MIPPHSPTFWQHVYGRLRVQDSLALATTCNTALFYMKMEGWRSAVREVTTFRTPDYGRDYRIATARVVLAISPLPPRGRLHHHAIEEGNFYSLSYWMRQNSPTFAEIMHRTAPSGTRALEIAFVDEVAGAQVPFSDAPALYFLLMLDRNEWAIQHLSNDERNLVTEFTHNFLSTDEMSTVCGDFLLSGRFPVNASSWDLPQHLTLQRFEALYRRGKFDAQDAVYRLLRQMCLSQVPFVADVCGVIKGHEDLARIMRETLSMVQNNSRNAEIFARYFLPDATRDEIEQALVEPINQSDAVKISTILDNYPHPIDARIIDDAFTKLALIGSGSQIMHRSEFDIVPHFFANPDWWNTARYYEFAENALQLRLPTVVLRDPRFIRTVFVTSSIRVFRVALQYSYTDLLRGTDVLCQIAERPANHATERIRSLLTRRPSITDPYGGPIVRVEDDDYALVRLVCNHDRCDIFGVINEQVKDREGRERIERIARSNAAWLCLGVLDGESDDLL